MTTTAFDKLTKAKARLVVEFPSMPFVEDTTLGTMATDGIYCYYDPAFVDAHSTGEIQGVLCHEALHKAYMHMLRKGARHHFLWNVACDFAINPIILQAVKDNPGTTMCLPKNCLVDDKYKNMSANEIYELLKKNTPTISFSFPGEGKPGDEKDPNKSPMWGGVMEAEKTMPDGSKQPLSQDEITQLEQEIKMTVASAAEQAKSRGKVPGGLEGLIKAVGTPKVNWQEYIQSWVKAHASCQPINTSRPSMNRSIG
jgi:predicted metal-dependent peptidase